MNKLIQKKSPFLVDNRAHVSHDSIMENTQAHDDGLAIRLVRVEMARRGLRLRHLAALAGFSAKRLGNCLCGNDPSWPPRAAINRALGRTFFIQPSAHRVRKATNEKEESHA